VFGWLVKFHLVIFNRWGAKVFETFDANRGWVGMLGPHLQSTGTYVWICTWKFIGTGQVEKKEKGTLILVR
jgi:hypothetical protein